jgi:hypothetical protein
MNDDSLKKMFDQWQSGDLSNIAGARFTGSLRDVPNHFVIVSMMPEEGQELQTLDTNEKAQAKISLHAFSHVAIWPLPQGGAVMGNVWIYGTELINAMPFPDRKLVDEFNAKIIDMGGVEIWTVTQLLGYLKTNNIPIT